MKCYKVIGYYICELCDNPEWLQGISRQILSVSGCIGEQHLGWECFGLNLDGNPGQLMELYEQTEDLEERKEIIESFYKFGE